MTSYEFTADSTVTIEAESSLHPISGETHAVRGTVDVHVEEGTIVLDPPPAAMIELPVEALESGHKLQDREMRRRVDAKHHPTIRWELLGVTGGPDRYVVEGSLHFHGVSRTFREDVTVKVENGRFLAEGEHTFDIREFDVKPPKILNLQVHPQVKVVARLVGQRVD